MSPRPVTAISLPGGARAIRVDRREAWNKGLWDFPQSHVLQTWDWGEVKAQTGWAMHPWRIEVAGRPVGQALVLRRPLPGLPWAFGYVPKGPILDWASSDDVRTVLHALGLLARRLGLLFLKIDPDVDPQSSVGRQVTALLREQGWRPSPHAIQFRNTVLVDLRGEEADLLARMKSKWRYNIRLAVRRGVRVRLGTEEDLPTFYALYEETARRDGFLIRPYGYYERVWRHFLARDMAALLLAEWESRPIAGVMVFFWHRRAWYMYGASAGGEVRRHMPNHLLQWEAMRLARSRGCEVYDMWGAPDHLSEEDPMWGVYRFKIGFGGVFQPWIGPWDLPVHPRAYALYVRTLPWVTHTLSRLFTRWRQRRAGA